MPGRTARDAYDAFIRPIQAAVACVGHGKIVSSPGARSNTVGEHSWSLNGPGAGLVLKGGICLKAGMTFKYVAHEEGWRVTTLSYAYSLSIADAEVWLMHFHPSGKSLEVRPHLHAAIGPNGSIGDHLPTGRMTFEDAVEWTITIGGAEPVVDDWQKILTASKDLHIQFRSWSGDGPVPTA